MFDISNIFIILFCCINFSCIVCLLLGLHSIQKSIHLIYNFIHNKYNKFIVYLKTNIFYKYIYLFLIKPIIFNKKYKTKTNNKQQLNITNILNNEHVNNSTNNSIIYPKKLQKEIIKQSKIDRNNAENIIMTCLKYNLDQILIFSLYNLLKTIQYNVFINRYPTCFTIISNNIKYEDIPFSYITSEFILKYCKDDTYTFIQSFNNPNTQIKLIV